jgi:hypothetical protein
MIAKTIRDHSLSITCLVMGVVCIMIAWPQYEEGRGWDLWLGFGHGFLTVALFGLLSGPLRERNKPEVP